MHSTTAAAAAHRREAQAQHPDQRRVSSLLDPMALAVALTDQADALPRDPHGLRTAVEMDLRRRAHLALNLTPEFLAYRRRARRGDDDLLFLHDWRQPDGSLVRQLAALRKPARRAHSVGVAA